MSAAFNTLEYSKKAQSAGFTAQQAEFQAEEFHKIIENTLATKKDLKDLEINLKKDLKDLDINLKKDLKDLDIALKKDLKELELRMIIKLGSLMLIVMTVLGFILKN